MKPSVAPMSSDDKCDARAVAELARQLGEKQLAGGRARHQGCTPVCATAQVLLDALVILSQTTTTPDQALCEAASALLDVVEARRARSTATTGQPS